MTTASHPPDGSPAAGPGVGRPVALVTGASGGIGEELARQAALDGHDLVLVARSRDRLDHLAAELERAGAGVEVLTADLQTDAGIDAVADRLTATGTPVVDVLVNNAGYGSVGDFAELSPDGLAGEITLNIMALMRLTRAALPGMLHRRRGGILNVASLASFLPGPGMANYSATKAYVLSLTEAIREEVTGSGVRITALCPGYTRTGFQERAGVRTQGLTGPAWQSAPQVAAVGWAGFRRGDDVIVPGIYNKISVSTIRLTPRPLVRKVAATSIRRLH